MRKEFLPYDAVRNNALKMARRIRQDGFEPDIMYVSLRGGAYVANVVSEYFKLAQQGGRPVLYAAVVARSYTDIRRHDRIMIDGWTYSPEHLRAGDKILLIDDIFDSGKTINFLTEVFLEKGIPRKDIKVAVHDYKRFLYKSEQLPVQPDYWCRKFDIARPEDDCWIHYMSHELVGLTREELETYYYRHDPELRTVLDDTRA
ncbi:phosphoribosyltransferase [Treponema endosymbiont of Eucomonympha sp.]|uniref:phosphoribosyltransferase n=1 Tax=Treponema endosymbiont of Eucomonympha sp. TaxID=1580831 RepID=UPI0007862732|nr:phosphoribosyltransferase [Treponema endosymbiont of Eucomonympha sp.]